MLIDANYFKIRLFAFDCKTVGSWWDFRGHISPFARIFLIEKGEQNVSFDGETYLHKAGHLALIPPYTPVDYSCMEFCRQHYFIFTCQLPNGKDLFADYTFPHLLEAETWQLEMCKSLLKLLPNYGLDNVDADKDDFNQQIFESTTQVLNLEQKLAGQGLVSILFSSFAVGAKERVSSVRFVKTFQFIESNLEADLSLTALAEIEGLSLNYFSDQFYLHTGVRPSEYIAQKRENRAKELLTTTKMSLPEVAKKIGITDPCYFSRFFKKRTGHTVRSYQLKRANEV